MGKRLVLAGAGHAHMTAMLRLDRYVKAGFDVTVVNPHEHHFYSGMGPGMLGGTYRPREIMFHVEHMVQNCGGTFIREGVARVDAEARKLILDSGREVEYDAVSFNTGSCVPMERLAPESCEHIFPVKPISNLMAAREAVRSRLEGGPLRLLVVGGGAAGVEIAGALWRLADEADGRAEITLLCRRGLAPGFPAKARRLIMDSFRRRGIRVMEHEPVQRLAVHQAVLDDGKRLTYDAVFVAVGVRPNPVFEDSGLPTDETGALLVNEHLQSPERPEVFGGGDCVQLVRQKLARVGVYAVRQNPVLAHNVAAVLTGERLQVFTPQKKYLLILNLGDGRGLFMRGGWVWEGRWAFRLKDWIDRRFMRAFQVSGEQEEG